MIGTSRDEVRGGQPGGRGESVPEGQPGTKGQPAGGLAQIGFNPERERGQPGGRLAQMVGGGSAQRGKRAWRGPDGGSAQRGGSGWPRRGGGGHRGRLHIHCSKRPRLAWKKNAEKKSSPLTNWSLRAHPFRLASDKTRVKVGLQVQKAATTSHQSSPGYYREIWAFIHQLETAFQILQHVRFICARFLPEISQRLRLKAFKMQISSTSGHPKVCCKSRRLRICHSFVSLSLGILH